MKFFAIFQSFREGGFIRLFFLVARRTNQEAPPRLSGFWLVATVAVGVCGTRFARIVLALFPPSSLRLHRPIKAESGDLACILTPSPYGHSPYIPCRNTGGEVEMYFSFASAPIL